MAKEKPTPSGHVELLMAMDVVQKCLERVAKNQDLAKAELRGIKARVDGLAARIDALTADTNVRSAALEKTQLTLEKMIDVLETRVNRLRDSVIPHRADDGEGTI